MTKVVESIARVTYTRALIISWSISKTDKKYNMYLTRFFFSFFLFLSFYLTDAGSMAPSASLNLSMFSLMNNPPLAETSSIYLLNNTTTFPK